MTEAVENSRQSPVPELTQEEQETALCAQTIKHKVEDIFGTNDLPSLSAKILAGEVASNGPLKLVKGDSIWNSDRVRAVINDFTVAEYGRGAYVLHTFNATAEGLLSVTASFQRDGRAEVKGFDQNTREIPLHLKRPEYNSDLDRYYSQLRSLYLIGAAFDIPIPKIK